MSVIISDLQQQHWKQQYETEKCMCMLLDPNAYSTSMSVVLVVDYRLLTSFLRCEG